MPKFLIVMLVFVFALRLHKQHAKSGGMGGAHDHVGRDPRERKWTEMVGPVARLDRSRQCQRSRVWHHTKQLSCSEITAGIALLEERNLTCPKMKWMNISNRKVIASPSPHPLLYALLLLFPQFYDVALYFSFSKKILHGCCQNWKLKLQILFFFY